MINIATNLERNAAMLPDKIAVHFGDRTFTYAQLNAAANQVANGLKALGIGKGDKVVLSLPEPAVSSRSSTTASSRRARSSCRSTCCSRRPRSPTTCKDSEAKAFFCFEGTPELPMGAEGHAGFKEAGRARTSS